MLEEQKDQISKEEAKEIETMENQLMDQIMNVSQVIKGYESGLILPDKALTKSITIRISGE